MRQRLRPVLVVINAKIAGCPIVKYALFASIKGLFGLIGGMIWRKYKF